MPTKERHNLRTVRNAVQRRVDFDCNGTLAGESMSYMPHEGRLPARFGPALGSASSAPDFYVVFSYATPIAWFANGEWSVPAVKYSSTTSRHLSSLGLPTRWAESKGADYVKLANA
jgi:hypothetical protein